MIKYFIAVLPIFLIVLLFNVLDKEKNKKKLFILILLFIFGALGSYITYRVENKVGSYFPEMVDMNYFMAFIYAIFGVAIFEEGVKLFFIYLLTLKEKYNKYFSWLNISVVCSMGYACFENIFFYVKKGDIFTAISRMFTSIPSHMCFAIFMGLFFIKYKKTKKIRYLILSLVVPTILHALYNLPLYKGYYNADIICINYLFILFSYSAYKVYKLRNN